MFEVESIEMNTISTIVGSEKFPLHTNIAFKSPNSKFPLNASQDVLNFFISSPQF